MLTDPDGEIEALKWGISAEQYKKFEAEIARIKREIDQQFALHRVWVDNKKEEYRKRHPIKCLFFPIK